MTTENQPDSELELDELAPEPDALFDPITVPVRFSHLKNMARSPLHYLQSARSGTIDTAGKRFGRGAHVLMLGGQVTVFKGERRGNKWKDFVAEHKGEEIVLQKEYDQAARLAEKVRAHPLAGPLLLGKTEHHIEWEWLGRRCSSRVDSLNMPLLTELKSTTNAEPEWFNRNALRLGYHAQLAFYRLASRYIGEPCPDVHIVAVEMKAPHAITVMSLDDKVLLEGEKLCRIWMEQLLVCEAANEWPPYVQSVVPFKTYEDFGGLVFGDEEEAA